jgi:hypothetical protein
LSRNSESGNSSLASRLRMLTGLRIILSRYCMPERLLATPL